VWAAPAWTNTNGRLSVSGLADFNDDGLLDVGGSVSLAPGFELNKGDGTFDNPTYVWAARGDAGAVVIADLNGDRRVDLASTEGQRLPPIVSVVVNAGDARFVTGGSYQLGATDAMTGFPQMASGDLDGDGDIDLVTSYFAYVSVLLNHGDATFTPPVAYPIFGLRSMALGDLDGDGKPDLAGVLSQGVALIHNNGDGTFAAPVILDAATDGPRLRPAGPFRERHDPLCTDRRRHRRQREGRRHRQRRQQGLRHPARRRAVSARTSGLTRADTPRSSRRHARATTLRAPPARPGVR